MISRDVLIKYVRIISGCDVDPNLTLVDFSLDDEQRNIVNLVNNEAKSNKNLSDLLDSLKYSNKKVDIINEYFDNLENINVANDKDEQLKEYDFSENILNARFCGRKIDSYGFANITSIIAISGSLASILLLIISFFLK